MVHHDIYDGLWLEAPPRYEGHEEEGCHGLEGNEEEGCHAMKAMKEKAVMNVKAMKVDLEMKAAMKLQTIEEEAFTQFLVEWESDEEIDDSFAEEMIDSFQRMSEPFLSFLKDFLQKKQKICHEGPGGHDEGMKTWKAMMQDRKATKKKTAMKRAKWQARSAIPDLEADCHSGSDEGHEGHGGVKKAQQNIEEDAFTQYMVGWRRIWGPPDALNWAREREKEPFSSFLEEFKKRALKISVQRALKISAIQKKKVTFRRRRLAMKRCVGMSMSAIPEEDCQDEGTDEGHEGHGQAMAKMEAPMKASRQEDKKNMASGSNKGKGTSHDDWQNFDNPWAEMTGTSLSSYALKPREQQQQQRHHHHHHWYSQHYHSGGSTALKPREQQQQHHHHHHHWYSQHDHSWSRGGW